MKILLVIFSLAVSATTGGSHIEISETGGYSNIVIKIRNELDQTECPEILQGIKVIINIFWFILYSVFHFKKAPFLINVFGLFCSTILSFSAVQTEENQLSLILTDAVRKICKDFWLGRHYVTYGGNVFTAKLTNLHWFLNIAHLRTKVDVVSSHGLYWHKYKCLIY